MNQGFWESKYPKIRKVHEGRITAGFLKTMPVKADVRSFIRADDWALQNLLTDSILKRSMPDILAMSVDLRIDAIQSWVIQHIEYQQDKAAWGQREFWQLPAETIATGTGDCEDSAFLLHSLLLNAGVEPWRLRSTAGWVASGAPGERAGHMYLTLCRDLDWVALDTCYHPEVKLFIAERTPIKKDERYQEVWYSFNHQACWSHQDIPIAYGRVSQVQGRVMET